MMERTGWAGMLGLLALVLLTTAGLAAEARVRNTWGGSLRARDARLGGGARFFANPERLGLPGSTAAAFWLLPQAPAGLYDVTLVYSSGQAGRGGRAGRVELLVGARRYPVTVAGTGGWGAAEETTVERVPLAGGDTTLGVRVVQPEPGIETALDLWRVDIFPAPSQAIPEAGQPVLKQTTHGRYWQYIPRTLLTPPGVLVIIHGTPGEKEPEADCAQRFLQPFLLAARQWGVIVLAPVFDTANFGGPGGGYRGLFGRQVRADEFVNEIIAAYQSRFPGYDGRIYLYGHSAGGQFVSRYLVMNAARVRAAVISSAGTFAFPDADVPWADGMAALRAEWTWPGASTPTTVDVRPAAAAWLQVAQLPVTVMAGGLERRDAVPNPGRHGSNVVDRAQQWVDAMQALARAQGKTSGIRLVIVEGVGHDGFKLAETGLPLLFRK